MPDDNRFYSSFRVEARLKCTAQQLRKRLDSVPSLKLASYGTELKYEVIGSEEKQSLVFGRNSIVLVFYFAKPSDEVFSSCLMRLMAILSIVDDLYEVRLGAVYNYVVDALGKMVPRYVIDSAENRLVSRLSREVEGLAFANSRLSHDIYDKAVKEKELRERLALCKEFCSKVIEASVRRGANTNEDIEKFFGIGAALIDKVTMIVKEGD